MEGPPTTMIYSPFAARALPPSRSNTTSNKESRRMKLMSRSTIYAEDENLQVKVVLDRSTESDKIEES
jgi:hypothetical protein